MWHSLTSHGTTMIKFEIHDSAVEVGVSLVFRCIDRLVELYNVGTIFEELSRLNTPGVSEQMQDFAIVRMPLKMDNIFHDDKLLTMYYINSRLNTATTTDAITARYVAVQFTTEYNAFGINIGDVVIVRSQDLTDAGFKAKE